MRLLEVDTLRFKVIHDPRQPIRVGGSVDRYAILSHTWDDGQELSYQDWQVWQQKGPGYQEMERRSGFHKIMDTCRKAKEMGYSLVWIDTICIDKSSSAELSEAINSMFAFYTHASVCLALLSDVENADGDEGFMNSRWFTRGWTLQELLAPDDVRFFDRGWLELGSKLSLEHRHLISRVTSIPEIFLLKNAPLSLASVAERLSWAARRNTTRTEDSSYCLLGIFDITMPLLYGEADKAFFRLQEEILKISTDHSVFAWSWPPGEGLLAAMHNSWVTFLAPNIRCFDGAGSIYKQVDVGQDDFASKIYSMTNLGLQIRLPLIHTSSQRSYALLELCPHLPTSVSGNDILGVPVRKIGGIYTRCAWPNTPVSFPRFVLKRQLQYSDTILLARRSSINHNVWHDDEYARMDSLVTPPLHPGTSLRNAFQLLFCAPGSYRLDKIALTRGASWEGELSMLQTFHDVDASLEETSPQQQETFKGALFFLRKTNVKITRLVQVLVGIRETAMGSTKLQLSICRKTIAGGGNAEANEISALCAKLEGKTPDANDIQRCFWTKDPDCEHKPSTDHTSDVQPDNVLVHAWHRTYNAAISRPIKELTHTADLEEEKGIKPLHVFIWEEMGSRSLKRETSDLGREELNADI